MADVVPFRPRDDDRLPVAADTSYEIALDSEPSGELVPVDPQPPEGEWIPAIPVHLRTVAGIRKAAGKHVRRNAHRAAVHSIRSPKYLLLATGWAVVGVFKVAGQVARWQSVSHAIPLEYEAAKSRDSKEWEKVHKLAMDTRRKRGYVVGAGAGALIAGGTALWYLAPWWLWPPVALILLASLARAGRPADKRIISAAVIAPRFRVLNSDVVIRAYWKAGLCNPDKEDEKLGFGGRPMRKDGDGSGVDIDLPYGKGLTDAMNAREKIASGLDVQVSQVFLHRDKTSHRRHYLWVADRDPLAVPVGRTPLLACKATDVWKAAPLGLDERGSLVRLLLLWSSVLVGALPRMGKSWTARALGLFCALDPFVKLDVFDAAGKPDWRKFALVADSCAFGLTPNRDGLPPEILLATLERIKADVQDRYNRLSELPTRICPEGKLTRQIARDPDMGMPVRVLMLDEFQEYYDLGDISRPIAEGLRFLVKVAPAAGVIPIWATQKPSGIGGNDTLSKMFNSTRDNFGTRFSLRTASYTVSEAVLGQGTYGMGLDSSKLLVDYKGVGILHGASDASPTVRCFTADDTDAEKILLAARALRERAGTLSGMAVGEEVSVPARDVLGDVLAVFGADTQLHWELLAARLARQFPERWKGATAESVSADVRALGVRSRDARYPAGRLGTVKKGCYAADVAEAAARGTAGQEG